MFTYILRRILISIPVLIGITIVNFTIINLAPGNPVEMLADPNMSSEQIAMRLEQLGLNDSWIKQYFNWMGNLLQGNLGYSLSNYEPVTQLIGERILPTVKLMGLGLLVGVAISIPLGVISAVKQYSKTDYILTTGSFLGISVPNFFLALGLIYIFSLKYPILPSGGMSTLGGNGGFWDSLSHLILPVSVLAVGIAGKKIRYVRASMLEILGEDYLRTARSKGLKEFVVTNKHALRNALIPVITVVGMEIPLLLGGAIITEQIFQWPGIGQLTIQSIVSRDYPTLMALNLLAACTVLFANLITDILYSIADPRIKYN